MVYPDYAWIVYSHASYSAKETTTDEDQDVCTNEDIINFLKMSRALLINIISEPEEDSVQTDTGFVSLSLVLIISFLSLKL